MKNRDIGKGPWRKGPPPSVGWWPADYYAIKDETILRWYDGVSWSAYCKPDDTLENITVWSARGCVLQHNIRWRERADWWPERSRT